jgi:hypothetical protein
MTVTWDRVADLILQAVYFVFLLISMMVVVPLMCLFSIGEEERRAVWTPSG